MAFDFVQSPEQFGGASAGAASPSAASTAPELTQSDLVPSVPDGTPLFQPTFAAEVNPPTIDAPVADAAVPVVVSSDAVVVPASALAPAPSSEEAHTEASDHNETPGNNETHGEPAPEGHE